MIDTINFRIHNFKSYVQLYTQLYTTGKNAVSRVVVDEGTGEMLTRNKMLALVYHDNNNLVPIDQRNKFVISSSHYSVSYFINQTLDVCDINVSIPKQKYGCNIMEFINFYDTSASSTWLYLKNEIDKFFKTYFIQVPEYQDIEITRIDLCYNQYFNNSNDSLIYLEEQKQLLKKYARSSKNDFRTYDTSWMYKTQRYTFKVYHKGDEFQRNDLKHLLKDNPLNYDLGKLTTESMRILRYEITIRPAYFKYLVEQHFFNDTIKSRKSHFKNHPVSKHVRKLKLFMPSEVQKLERLTYKLKLSSLFDKTTSTEILLNEDSITFDETIFQIIYDDFWSKVKRFQLSIKPPIADVIQRIKQRVTKNGRAAKDSSILTMAAMLHRYHTVTELYKTNLLPRATYYRLNKGLKELGISDEMKDIPFSPPLTDYTTYRSVFKDEHFYPV